MLLLLLVLLLLLLVVQVVLVLLDSLEGGGRDSAGPCRRRRRRASRPQRHGWEQLHPQLLPLLLHPHLLLLLLVRAGWDGLLLRGLGCMLLHALLQAVGWGGGWVARQGWAGLGGAWRRGVGRGGVGWHQSWRVRQWQAACGLRLGAAIWV